MAPKTRSKEKRSAREASETHDMTDEVASPSAERGKRRGTNMDAICRRLTSGTKSVGGSVGGSVCDPGDLGWDTTEPTGNETVGKNIGDTELIERRRPAGTAGGDSTPKSTLIPPTAPNVAAAASIPPIRVPDNPFGSPLAPVDTSVPINFSTPPGSPTAPRSDHGQPEGSAPPSSAALQTVIDEVKVISSDLSTALQVVNRLATSMEEHQACLTAQAKAFTREKEFRLNQGERIAALERTNAAAAHAMETSDGELASTQEMFKSLTALITQKSDQSQRDAREKEKVMLATLEANRQQLEINRKELTDLLASSQAANAQQHRQVQTSLKALEHSSNTRFSELLQRVERVEQGGGSGSSTQLIETVAALDAKVNNLIQTPGGQGGGNTSRLEAEVEDLRETLEIRDRANKLIFSNLPTTQGETSATLTSSINFLISKLAAKAGGPSITTDLVVSAFRFGRGSTRSVMATCSTPEARNTVLTLRKHMEALKNDIGMRDEVNLMDDTWLRPDLTHRQRNTKAASREIEHRLKSCLGQEGLSAVFYRSGCLLHVRIEPSGGAGRSTLIPIDVHSPSWWDVLPPALHSTLSAVPPS
ncbi:hypothetical protein BSKO_06676 [Bryopsis sp. KO-2023]|nr:hypothetical protein BSKO_06676 [Bryopsis sp. KO-2023]